MFSHLELQQFAENGFLVVKRFESFDTCDRMLIELTRAIEEDQKTHPNVFDAGMVHNCFMRGVLMRKHLESGKLRQATDVLLCNNAIIYAHQSSSLGPGSGNYGSRIHVDCPRFIPGYRTNLGYILALQPFTHQNGGTWVLPGSHLSDQIPSTEHFEANAVQLTCGQGDAIFFDARLYHRAGINQTASWRHGMTINFCRPYMRSRFDFPKMLANVEWAGELNSSARKYLGFDVRLPSSLQEFYLPESERLYLPNQE